MFFMFSTFNSNTYALTPAEIRQELYIVTLYLVFVKFDTFTTI